MHDPILVLTAAAASLAGLAIVAVTALKGWRGWLEVERLRLGAPAGASSPSPASRIELADLKERLRKLEAIAAGVDL